MFVDILLLWSKALSSPPQSPQLQVPFSVCHLPKGKRTFSPDAENVIHVELQGWKKDALETRYLSCWDPVVLFSQFTCLLACSADVSYPQMITLILSYNAFFPPCNVSLLSLIYRIYFCLSSKCNKSILWKLFCAFQKMRMMSQDPVHVPDQLEPHGHHYVDTSEESTTLQKCLADFLEPEMLQDWMCEKCGKLQQVSHDLFVNGLKWRMSEIGF